MKYLLSLIVLFAQAVLHAQNIAANDIEHVEAYYDVGDVNNDGKTDMAAAVYERKLNESGEPENDCGKPVCKIDISFGKGIDPISFEGMNVAITKALDVNGDNANELLVYRWWYECCWVTLDMYSYKTGQWEIIATSKAFITYADGDFRDRVRMKNDEYFLIGDKWNDDYSEIIKDRVPIK